MIRLTDEEITYIIERATPPRGSYKRDIAKAQLKKVGDGIPTWFVKSLVEINKLGKLPVGSGKVINFLQALLEEVEDGKAQMHQM